MKNLMLVDESLFFVDEEWKPRTEIYIDFFDTFAKAFGIEIDYDDLWDLGGFGIIDFWINFNRGKDGNIDTSVGILRMSIEVEDISYLNEDDKVKAQELIDKYELEEDSKGLLIKQVEKVQDFIVYWYKELY